MTASAIEWTDRVWNPVAGCQIVSPGCTNCYAMKMAHRLAAMGSERYQGLTRVVNGKPVWTGEVRALPEALLIPIKRLKPTAWFVNSMSDLWADGVSDLWPGKIFAVMAATPEHTYQILTKRPDRMAAFVASLDPLVLDEARPKNVILGCSVEDQVRADERRSPMAALAAAGWPTFVSYEPALGAVDWTGWEFLRWLISGGESGPGARPSHPDWHRLARDFCAQWAIPYFFKQWGAWMPEDLATATTRAKAVTFFLRGLVDRHEQKPVNVLQVGKKAAGRVLDGRTHDAFPELAR